MICISESSRSGERSFPSDTEIGIQAESESLGKVLAAKMARADACTINLTVRLEIQVSAGVNSVQERAMDTRMVEGRGSGSVVAVVTERL